MKDYSRVNPKSVNFKEVIFSITSDSCIVCRENAGKGSGSK